MRCRVVSTDVSVQAHLKNEKPVVIKINALAFQQLGDFREVAFLVVNVVIGAIVAVCSAGHSELRVWNKLKGLFPLQWSASGEHRLLRYCKHDAAATAHCTCSKRTVSMMS